MNTLHSITHSPSSLVVDQMSILDLALEYILQLLSPSELYNMARVCSSLRERCVSDHLWEKHFKTKWGKILGPAAHREWQCYLSSKYHLDFSHQHTEHFGLANFISFGKRFGSSLPLDSIMNYYLSLESGNFWFPAQVYNRENGHVGFMLSCYDAELSYDIHTDTFQDRYLPHGRRVIAIEKDVTWENIRAAPIDASPHNLYESDSLRELKPRDHIEIQWRRSTDFPYGWWYSVVGHLESCDGNLNHCHCHSSGKYGYNIGERPIEMKRKKEYFEKYYAIADGDYGVPRSFPFGGSVIEETSTESALGKRYFT